MGEDQGCPRDIADLAGAEGDVLEWAGLPAIGPHGMGWLTGEMRKG